jgi:hypothetical protein
MGVNKTMYFPVEQEELDSIFEKFDGLAKMQKISSSQLNLSLIKNYISSNSNLELYTSINHLKIVSYKDKSQWDTSKATDWKFNLEKEHIILVDKPLEDDYITFNSKSIQPVELRNELNLDNNAIYQIHVKYGDLKVIRLSDSNKLLVIIRTNLSSEFEVNNISNHLILSFDSVNSLISHIICLNTPEFKKILTPLRKVTLDIF